MPALFLLLWVFLVAWAVIFVCAVTAWDRIRRPQKVGVVVANLIFSGGWFGLLWVFRTVWLDCARACGCLH